jgi:hypothetical protein
MNRSSANLRREDSKKYKHSALRARLEGGDSLVVVTLSGADFPTGIKHQYSAATTGGGGSQMRIASLHPIFMVSVSRNAA